MTYIFSIASEISGQNSSTIPSNFFKANIFISDIGSSSNEIMPAEISGKFKIITFLGYSENDFALFIRFYQFYSEFSYLLTLYS